MSDENLTYPRYRHQTVILSDYTALIMGGQGSNGSAISSVESVDLYEGNITEKASASSCSKPTNSAMTGPDDGTSE